MAAPALKKSAKPVGSSIARSKPFIPPDYDKKLDFVALALQDADFADVIRATGGQVKWDNPEHVR
jgi:hypothetical protein